MNDIERRYQQIFQLTPIALWEEDFSDVYNAIDILKDQGVADFRTFFTENPGVLFELAGKIKILDINEHSLRVFKGQSKQELLTSIDKLFDEDTVPMFVEQLTAFAEGVDPFTCEAYVRTLQGDRIHILFSVKMLHKQGHALVSLIDITDRKRIEEQLRVTNVELKRSNEELEQFAYVASHDLQEPLRKIRSFGSLLEKRSADALSETSLKYLKSMVNAAERMQTLIDDLLTLSRTGRSNQPPIRVDCTQLVQEVVDGLSLSVKAAGAAITHDSLPEVWAEPMLLSQVVQNLLSNAIKFRGEEPPRVHIDARRDEKEWVFSVKDNGIGIEAKFLSQVFVAFKRLHGRGVYPGTGVGLAIVKKIVEYHGGRIWVESTPGRGSTFYFTVPVTPHPAERAT